MATQSEDLSSEPRPPNREINLKRIDKEALRTYAKEKDYLEPEESSESILSDIALERDMSVKEVADAFLENPEKTGYLTLYDPGEQLRDENIYYLRDEEVDELYLLLTDKELTNAIRGKPIEMKSDLYTDPEPREAKHHKVA